MTDDVVIIPSRIDEYGVPEATATLTPSSDKRPKIIYFNVRPCIPVIFLPGVMGTNLKSKDDVSVWSAPNRDGPIDKVRAVFSLLGWAFRDAATRQTRLNPNDTEVDNAGPIAVGNSKLSEDDARLRGWGEVHKSSYHGILAYLQEQLNEPMLRGKCKGDWHERQGDDGCILDESTPDKPVLATEPGSFGALERGPALTDEALKQFSQFQYPVHAIGYNWLQSNGASAEEVFNRIKQICGRYGAGTKAIIVTHSMGGIVARALARLVPGGEELIYGVVHGAQPATGAPVAAKRFRTGAEGWIGRTLFGGDDAEWTAVAANSQAALELMPMPDYRGGEPWWLICDAKGKPVLALPREQSSADTDIYRTSAWYSLIPDDRLIDPAGIVKRSDAVVSGDETVRSVFEKSVKQAVAFQASLTKQYHPHTYALYGDGTLSAPDVLAKKVDELMTYGTVRWQGRLPAGTTAEDLMAGELYRDDHQGTWVIRVRGEVVTLTVQGPDEPGDGTVPAVSAAAQRGAEGMQQVFKQGSFEHQFCYDHPWMRWGALYAVAQIAQLIPAPRQRNV